MAKATRKQALGMGLSKLINEEKERQALKKEEKKRQAPIKEIDGYILRLENDSLKEQNLLLTEDLKFCREQLSFMQKEMTTSLDVQDKLTEIITIQSNKAYADACIKARETDWTKKNE
tara:strand:+ start:177 stop:530 length:354 start_codon:yes stop_codon:yes gene_type:complete